MSRQTDFATIDRSELGRAEHRHFASWSLFGSNHAQLGPAGFRQLNDCHSGRRLIAEIGLGQFVSLEQSAYVRDPETHEVLSHIVVFDKPGQNSATIEFRARSICLQFGYYIRNMRAGDP